MFVRATWEKKNSKCLHFSKLKPSLSHVDTELRLTKIPCESKPEMGLNFPHFETDNL